MEYKIVDNVEGYEFIEVTNNANLCITLCTCGASVYSLSYDKNPMILTLKDKSLFLHTPQYYGKTLGRVCGRIVPHQEVLSKTFDLTPNEFENVLHGGKNNLSYRNFKYKIKENNKAMKVDFSYVSKDGDNGFPGRIILHVIYEIYKDSDIVNIRFTCTPSEDTILNFSNHMYFNFSGTEMSDYKLKICASKCFDMDEHLLPTRIREVPHALNFTKLSRIGLRMKEVEKVIPFKNIDHTFIFDEVDKHKRQVILANDEYKLYVRTTYDALNIYYDNSGTDVEFTNGDLHLRRGLAIEPQHNLLNRDIISIHKGEKYDEMISYKFLKN